MVKVEHHHIGPIPSPSTLREYEEVHPGLGKTIIKQWFDESEHRREIQKRALRDDTRTIRMDQFGALIIILAVIGAVTINPNLVTGILGGALCAIVIAFRQRV